MCGIAGILHLDDRTPERDVLLRMRDCLVHRGPDDAGLYLNGPVGLAHRRLSIVDLTAAGRQPMSNEDGTVWLVFNGEIYNYVELAAGLRARGHVFRSHTDSETIIHLYEDLGPDCVRELNGMFGFAIWDERRRRLFCARDRLGIKPFHYHHGRDAFVFASEMKAILEHPDVPRRPSYEGLVDVIFCGSTIGTKTVFDGIRSLPPGHVLTLDADGIETRPYWSVRFAYDRVRPDRQVEHQLHELLDDAIRIHCRSDASLGCHLSGGLDSSSVVAFAARHRQPLPVFSIRFDGENFFDESPFASAVARHVGAERYVGTPGAIDFSNLFAALIWHMDMPMPSGGGFAYFTVSDLARHHVKVTLTGHGGDEVFAGYPLQFLAAFGSTAMFELPAAPSSAPRLPRWLTKLRPASVRRTLRRLTLERRLRLSPLEKLWVRTHCGAIPEMNPLLHRGLKARLAGYSPVPGYVDAFRAAQTDAVLDRCLHHDLRSYLPGLLHMEDRVSMALSLESRVPLIDYRIVEFMATVPVEQKARGLEPKHLLRRVASSLLPPEILTRRDKAPFPVPVKSWFEEELSGLVQSVLRSPTSLDRGFFDPDLLRSDALGNDEIWTVLNVEAWFRIFIDQDAEWLGSAGWLRRDRAASDSTAPVLSC